MPSLDYQFAFGYKLPFVEFTNNSNGSGKNNRPYTIKKDWNSDNKVSH